ncbi:MAG TPA: hypothetical protein VE988_03360 [Gemmataceae bacterium]|nr:hypothetical protein [Gemmataceae bacterium]
MKPNLHWLALSLMISIALLLLAGRGDAGGDKGPWQPTIPKDIYNELAKREADLVKDLLDGKTGDAAIHRAKFGAMFIAGLTMSAKDGKPDDYRATREVALQLASTLSKKGQLAAAQKLASLLPERGKADPKLEGMTITWGTYLQKSELMDHFGLKKKGGDGMHPDLQSNIRLKDALNGIEEKIRALAAKELPSAGLKKEAKELELLGYHMAVTGSLTYFYAPASKVGKKDPAEWRTLALQMRDQSVNLAVAAKKTDAAGVLKASSSLYSTCNQCHTVFK